jgi:membrane associated rhomboid family serine protease
MTTLGGRLGRGALAVVLVEIAAFLVYAFADGPAVLRDHVALTPARAWSEPWQLVTSLLLHVDARDLIGSLVGVWIFGAPLERLWGPRRLIWFLVGTGAFAAVVMALVGTGGPVGGLAPSAVALVVVFGFLFAEPYVFLYGVLPLKGKHLCIFALVTTGLSSLTGGPGVHTVGLMAGAVAGVLHATGLWRPSRAVARISAWRARRRLRLVRDDRSSRMWN